MMTVMLENKRDRLSSQSKGRESALAVTPGSARAASATRTHDRNEDRGGHHEDRVGEAVLDGAVGSASAQLYHRVGVESAVCTRGRRRGLLRALELCAPPGRPKRTGKAREVTTLHLREVWSRVSDSITDATALSRSR